MSDLAQGTIGRKRMVQSSQSQTATAARGTFWALAAVLIFAIAFGGGGSKYGMANLIVVLAALVALSFHLLAFLRFWRSAPKTLTLLCGLTILLPAAYLIPLPQGVWSAMPGRELVTQSFELIGYEGWASASVNPVRTLLALTALITPLAVLTIGWSAPRERLLQVGWIAVGLGLANVAIGIPQVLSNSEFGVLYPENPMPGVLFGSFANRNTTGLFLVCTLAFATMLPLPHQARRFALAARIGIGALLVLAIFLTRSRTALVLGMIPIGVAVLRAIVSRMNTRGSERAHPLRKAFPLAVVAVIVSIGVAATVVSAPGRVADSLDRFSTDRVDPRAYIWDDATYSAQRYWPVGSGTGTFDDVFQIDESLENLSVRRAGRAHNDYLELVIETGLPGLVLLVGWFALLIWLSWRARSSPGRWIAWSGALALLVIALQSITDYPLRNQSMLAVASFALVLLGRFSAPVTQEDSRREDAA